MTYTLRMGAVIALLAILSGCQALQKVDQSLYQVAESVSERDRVTGQRSLSMANRSAQIQQGNAYVEKIIAQEKQKKRPVNAEISRSQYQRLVRIFDRVHKISHLKNERWQPLLIKRDSFNAFTTGGTYIVVHSKLMTDLKSDAELAAVIGHEIAHTVANHVYERQTHAQISALAGSNSARRSGYQAAFTHEGEREADRIGILYSALSGYDPMAASRIWQRKYAAEGNARALFHHDHPVNEERYKEAKAVGKAVLPYYKKGQINPRSAELLDNNVLWRKNSNEVAAGEGGGVAALLSTALGAYVQHEQAKGEERRQLEQARFVKAVEQVLKVESTRKAGTHKLETRWRYAGQGPMLKNVVIGLYLKRNGKVERYVDHVKGYIKPGQVFAARFTLPSNLKVDDLKKYGAKLYLDDAQAR
ncbi:MULTISPECIES: M48 family metallopeptidase [unclassified Neptuniibacter]|uniref:M48 family metallopeptidase n=1 Tax=unclassified Neptuniibacter TaxID=2630693 RepID=UPI0025FA4A35|nr:MULTISPECIES: M48 family metallopeptidase [unclassified Neptuniibacter]